MTRKRRRLGWVGWFAAAVALGVLAYVALPRRGAEEATTRDTVRVRRGELVDAATVSGTIEPHMQVDVYSRTAGEVVEVVVNEGQRVEQGSLLFRLDPTDAARSLRIAESTVRRLRAQLGERTAEIASAEASAREAAEDARIGARGVELGLTASDVARKAAHEASVAETGVALKRAQATSARAELEAALLAVEEAKRNVERTEVRAPFAGTVLSVGVERGSVVSSPMSSVNAGTAPVTLADLTDLRVIGQLDEAQIGRVAVGQRVSFHVDAHPDRTFAGRVERVSPLGVVDTNVVVFDVEIVVTDPDAPLLRSGMSADVEIVTSRLADALLVPLTAIRSRGSERQVELASGEVRWVRTGATDGVMIAVLDGLAAGDEVVADGRAAEPKVAPTKAPSGLLPMRPRSKR